MPLRPHPMEMFSPAAMEGCEYVTRQCKSIEAFDRHVKDVCTRFGYELTPERTLLQESQALADVPFLSPSLRAACLRFAHWLECTQHRDRPRGTSRLARLPADDERTP